jgi:hypothetical protein
MPSKSFHIALFSIAVSIILASHSYCWYEIAVAPPADWSGGVSNVLTGTIRTISNVLPSEWKENGEVVSANGNYSNTLLFSNTTNRFRAYIWLDTPLTSGTYTFPASSLKYMLSYVYAYYGNLDPNNGEGTGDKTNYQKYVDFPPAQTQVYYCSLAEAPAFPNTVQIQCQFKYAIQVPNNTPPGTYDGIIKYRIITDAPAQYDASCPIRVVVGNYFRLSVDRGSIDFGSMKPGEAKDNVPGEGIIVTAKTNTGNPWYLKISNDSPLSSGPYVIPNSNFIWYGWTDGAGTWYGTGTNPLTFAPELMYASGVSEKNNMPDGTNNHLKFKLTIPRGQPGGKYMSTVKLTLTE